MKNKGKSSPAEKERYAKAPKTTAERRGATEVKYLHVSTTPGMKGFTYASGRNAAKAQLKGGRVL